MTAGSKDRMMLPNPLASRWGRLIAFFFLYVTEGIPLGFTSTAMATQLRRGGVGVDEIGVFIGLLYLPWAWKWVAGPIVDLFYSNALGARRGWILGTQVMMVITLMACSLIDLTAENLTLLSSIIFIHNCFCATQDVAIDALACNTLKPEERGLANGLMFAGQTLGIPLGGACVLYLTDGIEWLPMLREGIPFQYTYAFVIGCILSVTILVAWPIREERRQRAAIDPGRLETLHRQLQDYQCRDWGRQSLGSVSVLFARPLQSIAGLAQRCLPRSAATPAQAVRVELADYVLTAGRSFFGSRAAFVALVFSLMPAGAFALNLALQKTLAVELGMSDRKIADLEVVSSIVWAIACVTGGVVSDRLGKLKCLSVFLFLTAVPTVWLGIQMHEAGWIMPVDPLAADKPIVPAGLTDIFWWAVIIYMLCQGLGYGTRTAVYMEICNPAVAATQFTAYMAMMNLVTAYTATWQGFCIKHLGYPRTLYLDASAGLICIALLPLLRNRNRHLETELHPRVD